MITYSTLCFICFVSNNKRKNSIEDWIFTLHILTFEQTQLHINNQILQHIAALHSQSYNISLLIDTNMTYLKIAILKKM